MKKLVLIAAMAVFIFAFAGCNGDVIIQISPSQEEESTRAEEVQVPVTADDVQEEAAVSKESDAQIENVSVSQTEEKNTVSDSKAEQDFVNLNVELSQGTLYIRSGSSFGLSSSNGGSADCKISNGTLYFKNTNSREFVLTLIEGESYEDMQLSVKNGHVYVESSLMLQTLNVEVKQGDARVDMVTVSGDSFFNVEEGSASIYVNFESTLTASCQNGQLNLKVPFEKVDSNYEINVFEGDVRLEGEHYGGKSTSKTIDNGSERLVKLTSIRGDISMEFGKTEANWPKEEKDK